MASRRPPMRERGQFFGAWASNRLSDVRSNQWVVFHGPWNEILNSMHNAHTWIFGKQAVAAFEKFTDNLRDDLHSKLLDFIPPPLSPETVARKMADGVKYGYPNDTWKESGRFLQEFDLRFQQVGRRSADIRFEPPDGSHYRSRTPYDEVFAMNEYGGAGLPARPVLKPFINSLEDGGSDTLRTFVNSMERLYMGAALGGR